MRKYSFESGYEVGDLVMLRSDVAMCDRIHARRPGEDRLPYPVIYTVVAVTCDVLENEARRVSVRIADPNPENAPSYVSETELTPYDEDD